MVGQIALDGAFVYAEFFGQGGDVQAFTGIESLQDASQAAGEQFVAG